MPNRLALETSPYLRQHADNPVDWHPWGEEAFRLARETGKPILLSIGYSACHWCHVMAHESFEDAGVAAVMNDLYVNIKVDREERPDLDQIYQTAHSLIAQRGGGWPLTMFLAPDQTPFFSGTYFPKEPRYNLPGFVDLLKKVRNYYDAHREEVAEHARALLSALSGADDYSPAQALSLQPLDTAISQLASTFDARLGGFGRAPKFPHPELLNLCLRRYAGDSDIQSRDMALITLEKMILGGIYDQLGGGFARYSVDASWAIPHFEKMLYDNGPLLRLAADAWCISPNRLFRDAAGDTAAWIMREMQSPLGGYYSALDADSDGEEGRFYVWTREEVGALLTPQEYRVTECHYGLDRMPNFEQHFWHLLVAEPLMRVAEICGETPETCIELLASSRKKLLAAREQRIRPARDEKILASWNALMIEGMARAGHVFDRADWVASARAALDFIRTAMWRNGRLLATSKDGKSRLNAYLDDYAYLLNAVLELLQVDFRGDDLAFAIRLGDVLLEQFEDRESGGFFFTSHDHEKLIQRAKSGHDNATPSGNGVAAFALQRLSCLTGEARFQQAAERALKYFHEGMASHPSSHATLLAALEESLQPTRMIIVRGEAAALKSWRDALRRKYLPSSMVLFIADGTPNLPTVIDKPASGQVNAWLCEGVSCLPPVNRLDDLLEILAAQYS